MTTRSKVIWSLIILVVLVLLVLWLLPGAGVQGAERLPSVQGGAPFDAALSRFRQRFGVPVEHGVERIGVVSTDARTALLQEAAESSTFVEVTPKGLSPFTLGPDARDVYREFLESLLEVGDVAYRIKWTLAGKTFTNMAFANADGQPKYEPVLYTLVDRSERKVAQAVVRNREQLLPVSLIRFEQLSRPAKVGETASWQLYNLLRVRVAWATLEIKQLDRTLYPEISRGSRFLWTVEPGEIRDAVTGRGKCLDAVAKLSWSSSLPNAKIGVGKLIEFAVGRGERFENGEEYLWAAKCR